jgi:hypothetical protein
MMNVDENHPHSHAGYAFCANAAADKRKHAIDEVGMTIISATLSADHST